MKKYFLLFTLVFCVNIFAQASSIPGPLSTFKFGILGGVNFHTIPTIGGTMQIEAKTNITSNLFAKVSIGYSSTFEDIAYDVKTYRTSNIEGVAGYQTHSYSVEKIEHSIFPVNLGLEYIILDDEFSPFAVFEIGYNIIGSEKQLSASGSGMVYSTIEEIPAAFKTAPPQLTEGEYLGIGFGFGASYKITSSVDLSVRYIFRYNESIINSNNIMLGITF